MKSCENSMASLQDSRSLAMDYTVPNNEVNEIDFIVDEIDVSDFVMDDVEGDGGGHEVVDDYDMEGVEEDIDGENKDDVLQDPLQQLSWTFLWAIDDMYVNLSVGW
ncbi:hypothetical protein L1987_33221 [Smallanthus sonchifolius]|uniref:Uncharacterized protein n=1 Tax=Smallanthus sonchifolius TaxID=185202 RepID=A0ACB9HRM7_9ASTR|nr:hypothetical protein L1987_33221 [Smallanthus sonchifolius]